MRSSKLRLAPLVLIGATLLPLAGCGGTQHNAAPLGRTSVRTYSEALSTALLPARRATASLATKESSKDWAAERATYLRTARAMSLSAQRVAALHAPARVQAANSELAGGLRQWSHELERVVRAIDADNPYAIIRATGEVEEPRSMVIGSRILRKSGYLG